MRAHLLFVGDSDTWGAELEGLEGDHARRESLRFSNLVAKALDKTYHNISLSGACNDWIVKNTIEWFEAGNVCETAVIQFSEPRRWGYYDQNGIYENMANQKGWAAEGIKNDQLEAHKAYYESVWSLHLELDNYYKNLFFLHNYLQYRCRVIFNTLLARPVPGEGKYETVPCNYWADLCKNIEIGSHKTLINYNFCPKIDRTIGLAGSHPNEIGHQNIANYIISKINES